LIDLHSHVLSGIDDGPDTIEGSVELARAAAATGIRTLVATPHVSWHYPNDADTIAPLVAALNARLAEEGIELEVLTGAEIAMTRVAALEPEQLSRLGLGGGSWLLIEPPFTPVATGLDAIVLDLVHAGRRVLLAHPERCPALQRDPEMLRGLVGAGVLTSITAGSFVGRFGGEVRRFALELAREGLIHNVASDAHDNTRRPPGVAAELDRAGLGPLTEWLTESVPRAILDGGEIPPRPDVALPRVETAGRSPWRPGGLFRRASSRR
jgi:protein-tyrosine phosphatase